MKYRLYQIDSFTRERFHGNPAGVVPNAEGLAEEQMQRVAREMNNSETAFIFPPEGPDHDVRVRFFTPTQEVPLCGHATVAAHYVRALEGTPAGRTVQKTGAGILPVDILEKDGDYSIVMTQGEPKADAPLEMETVEEICQALGISVEDLRPDCPVAIASAGYAKIMVGIRSTEQLHALTPDEGALKRVSKKVGCNGYYVFTLSPEEKVLVHGRMFSPGSGISEDPVTGNANGPLGVYLVHFGICPELQEKDCFDFDIIQGEAIRRDGGMHVHIDIRDGKPVLAQITGDAVVAFKTEIEL